MASSGLKNVIHTLRRAGFQQEGAELSDGQLLERYVGSREQDAFAALVHRHGPMVWGVCRRVLGSHHDAEDAFQATFLVLVRKAPGIVPRDLVANWLYGVAHQTALKARATTCKRGAREKQVIAMPEPAIVQNERGNDLQTILDRELSRLPAKYRAVIVLCDLEGKTRKEAARHFHLPEGTVATRLMTARTMLAKRLRRSGLAMSGGLLATLLSQQTASASLPPAVASETIHAATCFAAGQAAAGGAISASAALLAEGVLKAMLLTKLKLATAILLVLTFFGAGATILTQHVLADRPATDVKQEAVVEQIQPRPVAAQKPNNQPAQNNQAEPLPTLVSGIVKNVDTEQKTVTVTHSGGVNTFNVAKGAKIEIDGKPGDLSKLPAGASVNLRQFVDAKTTSNILAEGRWFWGTVKAIDAEKSTLSFGDKAQDGAAGKTFNVPKDLFISIDGKGGKLAGIPAGASVNLQLLADQTTVRSLSAEGGQVSGIAKAVDAQKSTITINDVTYPVAQDAHIGIDHQPGKLGGVPPGANVTIHLRVDQKTVLRISAAGASIFGNVKAVDIGKNTITVAGHPDDRTFRVPEKTHIIIDGKAGKLADIPVGSGLHCMNLCVDQQTANSINVVGPSFHHVAVKAVDADRKTITFDDKAPADIAGKTLAVAGDAQIQVDGRSGNLAGIPAGAFLNLGLSVDQQTIRNLQAEGPNLGGCGGSVVRVVDLAKLAITFDEKGCADVAGKTFNIVKEPYVTIDNQPGKLADVPTGSCVNLTLTVDQTAARHVSATGSRYDGIVKALDGAKSTITVDDAVYPVAKNALIVIDGRQVTLADLQVGASVMVNLRADQRTVGMIQTNTK